jgi:hypothetical protein
MKPDDWCEKEYRYVVLIITVCTQEEYDRDGPRLKAIKLAYPWLRVGLSVEPMLGPMDLGFDFSSGGKPWLDWIICGGESGPDARPMHPDWPTSLHAQCHVAGVPYHFKQWGVWAPHKPAAGGDLGCDVRRGHVTIVHPTGEDDVSVSRRTGGRNTIPGSRYMARVGVKASGRKLRGIEHNGFPKEVH